jgi:peptidoglycan/xylan/chitin deacetylase (PgdA/CDA1 family)
MRRSLVVLGWHNVAGTWCFPDRTGRGRAGLAQQLHLLQRSAHVVDLSEALDTLASGGTLPPRAVALTFDDGYRDNLTDAVPLLRDLGLSATFFLVPHVLSGVTTPWWEVVGAAFTESDLRTFRWEDRAFALEGAEGRRSYEAVCESLKRCNEQTRQRKVRELVDELHPGAEAQVTPLFLDWDDARALVRSGMRVGSHSLDHVILANEEPAEQRRNLRESRQLLESQLDTQIRLLAYPNGSASDFDGVTERAACEAGYQGAVTTIPGRNGATTSPFRLRRFVVGPEQGVVGLRSLVTYRLHDAPQPAGR